MIAIAESRNEDEGGESNVDLNDGHVLEDEKIAANDSVCASSHESLNLAKPVGHKRSTGPKSNGIMSKIDHAPPIDELYNPSSSLTCTTTASEIDHEYLNDSSMYFSSSLTCANFDSENEHVYSTNSSNTSFEVMPEDLSIPDNKSTGNAMSDYYQQGYQALKIENTITMMVTKMKNYTKEKVYLERIISKLQENSPEFVNLSKSIAAIDEQIDTLTMKRHNILESEFYKNINTSFRAIKEEIFDTKHKNEAALDSLSEMSQSSVSANSVGRTVSKSEVMGKGDLKEPPIPSILHLNKSISGNCSYDSLSDNNAQNSSSRKYRTIILRCSTFIIKPFIPLLWSKKKDDTLPYPLRL